MINNLKKYDTQKIQLATANNFISSIDNEEERVIQSKINAGKHPEKIIKIKLFINKYN